MFVSYQHVQLHKKKEMFMKKKKETIERDFYLQHDFGDVLKKPTPVKLDLEFPSPTQSNQHSTSSRSFK